MTCDQFRESYELYALGLLEDGERTLLADHLREGCENCRAELGRALEQTAMVSKSAPLVTPSRQLRRRIADSFGDNAAVPKKGLSWQWAYWALAAATILALTVGLNVESRAHRAEQHQFRAATNELARMSNAIEIMQAPGTEQVAFGNAAAGTPRGNLFVHRRLGVVLVAGHLSAAPEGWKYESWIVPKSGPPQPVESFQPDANGQGLSIVPGPVKTDDWKAIAVSMEPNNSEPVRPTKLVFAASLNSQQG